MEARTAAATSRGTDESPVRVVVAENHPLYREALVATIRARADLQLVAEVENGLQALEAIEAHRPDVALLDVKMPELGGIDVLRELTRRGSATHGLLLSAYQERAIVSGALADGAAGYLSKDASGDSICDAIVAVGRDGAVTGPDGEAGLSDGRGGPERRARLSAREIEVMTLTADGHSAREIGRRLNLSATTVKSHLRNSYAKLGVSDRAAAVAESMRLGLLR